MTDTAASPPADDHAPHDHEHDPPEVRADESATRAADCQQAVAELYTFLDGFLTDEKRHGIQQHLDDCGPCLEAFEFEVELRAVVAHRCKEEVPESLKMRVAELLDGAATGSVDSLAD